MCIKRFKQIGKILILISLMAALPRPVYSQDISRKQADFLLFKLRKEKTDTAKFKILLKLASFQISKPNELKADLDSAKRFLDQAKPILSVLNSPTSSGYFNLIQSDYFKETGNDKLSQDALDKAIVYLKSGKDQSLLASAYEKGCYRLTLSITNIPIKIHFMQLAAAAYGKTANKRKLGDCMRLLADLRTIVSIDERVLPELDSAKRLYQQANSGDWQQLYIIYAKYYAIKDNYPKALEAILNALRRTSPSDSSSEVCELDHHAAILFYRLKDYKQSLVYGNKALKIAERKTYKPDIYEIAFTLVNAYSAIGEGKTSLNLMNRIEREHPVHEFDDAFMLDLFSRLTICNDLKLYSKGQVYFNYLMKHVNHRVTGDGREINTALVQMIPFCINTGQYQKARELLNTKEEITKQLGSKFNTRIINFKLWLALDTARKDFKSATRHLLKINDINDSLFNETQTRQLKEMEVQYQTERKENENNLQKQKILTLSEQQKLQHAELKTADITRNVTLICALCIIIIAGLIYRQYVITRKNNAVIEGKNKRLELLLNENDWLIKEVHHRVKNNLQIITSLLNSQSAYLEDGAALDAILKSKGRVESISLIHQKLYRTENQSSIYMPDYVQDLVQYLKDSFVEDQSVLFDLSIGPIDLDVSDAVPIGLIINESVTNSIKHAFTNKGENTIKITLEKTQADLLLIIRDNGKGFNSNGLKDNNSFGLLLINGLADELSGKLEILDTGGTEIRLHFKPTSISMELRRQSQEYH